MLGDKGRWLAGLMFWSCRGEKKVVIGEDQKEMFDGFESEWKLGKFYRAPRWAPNVLKNTLKNHYD